MPPPNVAVLGGRDEPEVNRLLPALRERRLEPLLIDTFAFPDHGLLSAADGRWVYNGVDLSTVRAVFLRRLFIHPLEGHLADALTRDARATVAACREKESLLHAMLGWFRARGAAVVNPACTLVCHFQKVETLRRLGEAGVQVPRTLATNDPAAVREFAARHGDVIYKPLSGGASAQLLALRDLAPARLDQLRRAPVMFQERIHGDDVRVYTLAGRVIAGGMLRCDVIDFRTTGRPFAATELSPDECDTAIRSAAVCDLSFAGIDLKRSPGGRCTVLDVNPAPMFAAFEDSTGCEITDALAEHLAGHCA